MRLLLQAWVAGFALVVGVAAGSALSPPTGQPLRSPDGRWSVRYSRKHLWGQLTLTELRSGRSAIMYRSNDACCDDITWLRPHLLVFVDDYNVKTLNPASERLHRIAGFSDFVVSPDGRWIAGYADSGGHAPETVDVVPPAGGSCLSVPRTTSQDDSSPVFTRNSKAVLVIRRHFNQRLGYDTGPWRQIAYPLTTLQRVSSC